MLTCSTSLKFPGLLELQKWQPVYPHIVGRIPNSIGRRLTLSKTQVRGAAAAAVVNTTRSVLGRIQRLELTSYQRVDSGRGQDRTLRGKAAIESAIDGWS